MLTGTKFNFTGNLITSLVETFLVGNELVFPKQNAKT